MKCNKCGKENIAGSKFCCECGSKLERLCPQCQHPIAENIKFCPECGANLLGQALTSAIMKDNVIAGDVNQTVNASYITNIYNPVDINSKAELECCACHAYIPRSREQQSTCIGCGRLFCDKHMENRVCRTCQQAKKLSPFVYERLAGGKYIIKGVKKSLPAHIIIPEAVEAIDAQAFENAGIFEVTLPEGLVRIGARAFANCKYLEKINFPQSLKRIEEEAFINCKSLDLEPSQHVRVDATAFHGTYYQVKQDERHRAEEARKAEEALKAAEARKAEETRKAKEALARQFEFATETKNGKTVATLSKVIKLDGSNVVIPKYDTCGNPVIRIGERAFKNCKEMTSVSIPNSVVYIDALAFEGCDGLTSVAIPDSVIHIGHNAFYTCANLADIFIPQRVISIGVNPFSNCIKLRSITVDEGNTKYHSTNNCLIETSTNTLLIGCKASVLPHGITKIGNNAFNCCTNLTSITIPNSVTSIGKSAFTGCVNLTSITIPNSVTSIGVAAFANCTALTNITIPNSVTRINDCAFSECTNLTNITIPNSVTSIGKFAFYRCRSLISITIPNSVTNIESEVFAECSALTSITIPNRVTHIGYRTFANCTSLTSITIPNSVTHIGLLALLDCNNLTSIAIPYSVTNIGDGAFSCRNLKSIIYKGTMAQWQSIDTQKHNLWTFTLPAPKVICTDGTVQLK